MEWIVTRVFGAGRVLPVQMRNASTVRGRVLIGQEHDPKRGRYILVARLLAGEFARVPSLHDVVLLSANDSVWTLAGHERIEAGPMREEHHLSQTWLAGVPLISVQ